MLTELQKARVRFHLGYPNDQISGPRLELEQNLVLGNLAPMTELAIAGNPLSDQTSFEGFPLCSETSILGRLEAAWSRLGPATIDDSLFVSVAGSVNLRSDELRARRALYESLVDELARALDVRLFSSDGRKGPSYNY